MADCRAVLVSAPASGLGKTVLTAALVRAWRKQGLRVQAFKCGPDFLDAMILQVASGQQVYNLDLTLCGEDDIRQRLAHAAQHNDVLVVEGVMGLYDGQPSTADLAQRFGLPVLLCIDASGMAQTFGALAQGLLAYRPELTIAGVIANKVGSAGHAHLLQTSLPQDLPWFGSLPHQGELQIGERHLGLYRADEIDHLEALIEQAATLLGELRLPPICPFTLPPPTSIPTLLRGKTIAIARDQAFCFIYAANLDTLRALGAELRFFSPLKDDDLPAADAYWFPGGYPELHLAQLSERQGLRDGLQAAWSDNKPILAECGGMMALGQTLNELPMLGLLPGHSRIEKRLQGLGALRVAFPQGELGAHTFHYGRFETDLTPAMRVKALFGEEPIYRHGSLCASFLHFYFGSNPFAAAQLFDASNQTIA